MSATLGKPDGFVCELPRQRGDQGRSDKVAGCLEPFVRIARLGLNSKTDRTSGSTPETCSMCRSSDLRVDSQEKRIMPNVPAQINGWDFTGLTGFNGFQYGRA